MSDEQVLSDWRKLATEMLWIEFQLLSERVASLEEMLRNDLQQLRKRIVKLEAGEDCK